MKHITDRVMLIFLSLAMLVKLGLLFSVEHELGEMKEMILQNRATVVDFLKQTKEREEATAAELIEQLRAKRKVESQANAISDALEESKQKLDKIEEKLK